MSIYPQPKSEGVEFSLRLFFESQRAAEEMLRRELAYESSLVLTWLLAFVFTGQA